MKKQKLFFLVILLTAFGIGCGFYHSKSGDNSARQALDQKTLNKKSLGFEDIQYIFNNACVHCHNGANPSGGISVDNYDSVKASVGTVCSAITSLSMPPRSANPLTPIEIQIIAKWVAQGAPEYPSPTGDPIPTPTPGEIKATYASIRQLVLVPSCIDCHNASTHKGDIDLSTYAGVKENIDKVHNEVVVEQSMPPKWPLSADQIQAVADWIAAGAPEGDAPVEVPTPTPAPTGAPPVLSATYSSIHDQIFVPKCMSCHGADGKASDVPLEPYSELIAQTDVVSAGDAESSSLYTETSKLKMPPKKSGPPLNSVEIETIKTWINQGAKND